MLHNPEELRRVPPTSYFGKRGRLGSQPQPDFAPLLSRSAMALDTHFVEEMKTCVDMILCIKPLRRRRCAGMRFNRIRHGRAKNPCLESCVILASCDVVGATIDQSGTAAD